ncbi:MAG TPA: phosphonate ABC transporter, permease protein PhnE [Rhodocyclaceae bacterium]
MSTTRRTAGGARAFGESECRPRGAADFCLSCVLTSGLLLAAVVGSFVYLGIDFGELFSGESAASMGRFAASFFPPDLDPAFLWKTIYGALQTFAVAAVGTLLAAGAGLLLALPASGRHGIAAMRVSRFSLNLLRSVPELVWATLMVLAAGLGPFAGTLALALHTTGVLGRLFAEAIENAPNEPEQSLLESGSGSGIAFVYGTLPLVWPQCIAYGLYRLEMNIRMAAVLGFVGAGGLGQMLYFHLSIFQQAQASTVLIAMFVLVLAVDFLSDRLRARMSRT